MATGRGFAFVATSAVIMVCGSERVFWYYTDATVATFAELALFYALAVYAFLWFVDRYRVDDTASLMIALPVYGYVVEGVITPVIYSGGPLPVFPLWFTGWHGGIGLLVLWYGLRRLLVSGRRSAVLALAVAMGLFWGTWATTMWLPENLNDPELAEASPRIRSVVDFARYATATSVVLAGAHWLLGRGVWLAHYRPSDRVARPLFALSWLVIALYSVAYFWAVPMMLVLLAPLVWLLRRHRQAGNPASRVGLLAQLAGPVSVSALLPLMALPATASLTYGAWWRIEPGHEAIRVFMYSVIAVQSVGAGLALALAGWKVARRRTPTVARALTA